ncbi:hypothetical protein Tco_0688242 [Tanacetum coccineum]
MKKYWVEMHPTRRIDAIVAVKNNPGKFEDIDKCKANYEEASNDADNEMFDVNVLNGKEVFVAGQNENVVEKVVDAAQVNLQQQQQQFLHNNHRKKKAEKEKEANISLIEEWDDIQAKIDADYQLVERLQAQEQEELSDAEKATLFQQLL